ncbi:MAG: hypothetical protein JNK38_28495 [Acidobacteria bacterium]|nr:hypothetical protein [Acidobacteriota bacterium]
MNRFKIPLLIIVCLVAITLVVSVFSPLSSLGEVKERWEVTGNAFRLRVIKYAERSFRLVGGAYYVFEIAAAGSGRWTEIMTVRHDDPDPIPREQVRIVNDQVGYVFMLSKYAATMDAGATWFIWDAEKDFPDWQSNPVIIKEVRLAPDGTGIMTLTSVASRQVRELHTKDYGRHWNIE